MKFSDIRRSRGYFDNDSGVRPLQGVDVYTDDTRPILYGPDGSPLRRPIGFAKTTTLELVVESDEQSR